MNIHFIYRSAPGSSKKETRPSYFDKVSCLKSFLKAVDYVDSEMRGDLIFLNDGELDSSIMEIMNSSKSELIQLGGIGNSSSLRAAHELARTRNWDSSDIIYFAEDDYMYKEEAFAFLLGAASAIKEGHYFTLYDHPDRYTRSDDVNNGYSKIYVSPDCHWRTVESTCQTYGVRIKSFKKDQWIHKLGTSLNTPRGREMFRAVQGIGKYFWKFPKHKVISPMPSLCTHMETQLLANNVNWEKVTNSI